MFIISWNNLTTSSFIQAETKERHGVQFALELQKNFLNPKNCARYNNNHEVFHSNEDAFLTAWQMCCKNII